MISRQLIKSLIFLAVFCISDVYAAQILLWQNGSSVRTFGPGEAITIDIGSINFINGCPPGGVDDTFSSFSDIYIVPTGSATVGSTLADITQSPNTVQGAGTGSFVSQFIGSTKTFNGSTNGVGIGTYDVIYDECQDGKLDSFDALFSSAISVQNIPSVPTLPSSLFDQIKADALSTATNKKNECNKYFSFQSVVEAAKFANDLIGLLQNPLGVLLSKIEISNIVARVLISGELGSEFSADPVGDAAKVCFNVINQYTAIAQDPPDPNFQRLVTLGSRNLSTFGSNDPLVVDIEKLSKAYANESEILQAFLSSVERYQGAEIVDDGFWALIHARGTKHYSDLLIIQLSKTNSLLSSLIADLSNDTRPVDNILAEFETLRSNSITTGLSIDEDREGHNLGLTTKELDIIQADFVSNNFAFTKADLISAYSQSISDNNFLINTFSNLSSGLSTIIVTLESDSLVADDTPHVVSGGPYSGVEGTLITFDGTSSTSSAPIILYEWDLDEDGAFDDGTGSTQAFNYDHPFEGFVGLRVTDTLGISNVSYSSIDIKTVNSPPFVDSFSPDPKFVEVLVDTDITFSVTTSDPEGDLVIIKWFLDGVFITTGDTFIYSPTSLDLGFNHIEAVVTDSSNFGGSVRTNWFVAVLFSDNDGDGWNANTDCNDNDSTVNPDAVEIALNGKDDDCDSTTPETGIPPTAFFTISNAVGIIGQSIQFNDVSTDTDGSIIAWAWDFENDGIIDSTAQNPAHTFTTSGSFFVTLQVTDDQGNSASNSGTIPILKSTVREPTSGELFYSTFGGIDGLHKVDYDFDGVTFNLGTIINLSNIANIGADGLLFAPDGALIVGGGSSGVNSRIELDTGVLTESFPGGAHVALDPSGLIVWSGAGQPGDLAETPLNPFGNGIRHSLNGDDLAITQIVFDANGHSYYSSSGAGGFGNFGFIDLNTFTTTRLLSNLPAAHGMAYDPFTGDLMLFGDSHITQFDPTTNAVISDRQFTSVNFDQGAVDGRGRLFVASNTGDLLFMDYSLSGRIGDLSNLTNIQFLQSQLDDVAPLSGLGAQNTAPSCQNLKIRIGENTPTPIVLPCSDPDTNDVITIEIIALNLTGTNVAPSSGILPDGKITVTPNANFDGDGGSLTFQSTDGSGAVSEPAVARIIVQDLGQTPTLTADAGIDQIVNESDLVTLDGSGSFGLTTLQYNWSQVAGQTVQLINSTVEMPSFNAPLVSSDQTLSFQLIVEDASGNTSAPDTVGIFVKNINNPPSVTADQPVITVNEKQTSANTGTVNDPEGDAITLNASEGSITNNNDGTWSWSFATTDGPAESQTVIISADDGNGAAVQTSFELAVNNVAPTVDTITVPVEPLILGTVINANATFSDPAGTNDEPYICTVDYGDGTGAQSGTVTSTSCSGPVHTFLLPGIYAVTVTISDKDGDSGSLSSTDFVVVYDPNGGFVTGGGIIDSPAGAFIADTALTGHANFGFVAKYKKGKTIPTGSTEFQFQTAGFNFHSSNYEALVVTQNGSRAQYWGSGTINGVGGYKFKVWATDGNNNGTSVDTFRIKVWVEDASGNENVIYDNGFDQAISQGNIVIHNK